LFFVLLFTSPNPALPRSLAFLSNDREFPLRSTFSLPLASLFLTVLFSDRFAFLALISALLPFHSWLAPVSSLLFFPFPPTPLFTSECFLQREFVATFSDESPPVLISSSDHSLPFMPSHFWRTYSYCGREIRFWGIRVLFSLFSFFSLDPLCMRSLRLLVLIELRSESLPFFAPVVLFLQDCSFFPTPLGFLPPIYDVQFFFVFPLFSSALLSAHHSCVFVWRYRVATRKSSFPFLWR